MRHPMEARDSGSAFTTRQDISVSDDRNSLKIGARGRTSAETFRFGAKGKIDSAEDCFGPGQQTTRLNLDLTLNAEHQFGGE
jgi:hypothetical protein